jgi:FkbM family methyltransferase
MLAFVRRLVAAARARPQETATSPGDGRNESYSQEGEDLVLRRMLGEKATGFYVDIGAHAPIRYSNTYYFYRLGWNGLNVDAAPGSMSEFRRLRPRDINVEMAVAAEAGSATLSVFDEPALNTLSPTMVKARETTPYRVVSQQTVRTMPLRDILAEHVGSNRVIDFLSVDVEGLDEVVLRSNDWSRFRPLIVLVEILETDLTRMPGSSTAVFLRDQGYSAWAKLYNTAIFIRSDFVPE